MRLEHSTYVRTAAAALASAAIMSCGSSPPDDILLKSGPSAIVFVSEPSQDDEGRNPMESNVNEYFPGTDLFLLTPISPQGELRNLTEQYTKAGVSDPDDYGAAVDPEVSFDGKRILFSMKINRNARWRLYEMNSDGSGLVQLTDQVEGADMDPVYLPDGRIMFTSTRSGIVDEYERRDSPLLHIGDRAANGSLTNVRQVSFNQSHDTNPMVHSSGKVIYSRWEHLGDPNKFPLFVINPDGTRPFVMYGNHSPSESGSRVFLEPRELSDGGIVCSVMERNSPFEGGAIAIIDISQSDDNLTFITPATAPFNNTGQPASALYKTPHPIVDKAASASRQEKLLFAMSPIPVGGEMEEGEEEISDYGIYVMDKDGGNVRLIYNNPSLNEYDAVPVMPREEVPGGMPNVIPQDPNVTNALASGQTTGIFFDGNVYDRARTDGQLRPDRNFVNTDGIVGQARYLRILEAVPLPRDFDEQGGPIGNTDFEKQRVVGYAPIRPDGSFSVEVPANTSLHMQTLDENGMMLVNQMTWVQVMPGERRLCTGCHDSHDRDQVINDLEVTSSSQVRNKATGIMYEAGFDDADLVTAHSAARSDTVDFFDRDNPFKANTVQAAFEQRCLPCHGFANLGGPAGGLRLENLETDKAPPGEGMGETTSVYDSLTTGGRYREGDGDFSDYTTDDGARESPLAWVMFNRQLDDPDNEDYRPLSYDHRAIWSLDQYGRPDPFLSENRDLLSIIEWIDAGTQYSNNVDE